MRLRTTNRLPGTKDSDELAMSDGNDRVFARGGDDSVDGGGGDDRDCAVVAVTTSSTAATATTASGGQDDDYLDGGDGDDYINGRGDGRDGDEVVCGDGYDVAVLGRGDEVVGEDDCEKVRQPKGRPREEAARDVRRKFAGLR